jgi:calcineurin-like phosphoesterase family protein
MDTTIIDNINNRVKSTDTLYHLGDFAFQKRWTEKYRNRINCDNIILVMGNHDPCNSDGTPKAWFARLFSRIYTLTNISVKLSGKEQFIVLSHYAMRTWNKSHYGSWNLYGHSHGVLSVAKNSLDVGVDNHHFCPISIEDVQSFMERIE